MCKIGRGTHSTAKASHANKSKKIVDSVLALRMMKNEELTLDLRPFFIFRLEE